MDYISLYHMEQHLFSVVGPQFRDKGDLSAFDFFCIVIWKANRAKSRVALKLLSRDTNARRDLGAIVHDIAAALHAAPTPRERLRILVKDWDFRLPMATAILAVLWPHEFTVYDVRVCDALAAHHNLSNKTNFSNLWSGYVKFKEDVQTKAPAALSLRDKDRHLWSKSFAKQLRNDINTLFSKEEPTEGGVEV